MTNRKITPEGILVLSADAPREQWLAERKNGITATDIPAILGLNKYKTAIDVWNDKLSAPDGNFEPAIGNMEAAFWGIQLEDTVAKAWAEQNNFTIRRIGIIQHASNPWARASLDRLVSGCPDGRCALEVKTRSGFVGDEWDKTVPQDVNAQVQWQLLVSGLDHIHVIALIGGQRLVHHSIKIGHGDLKPTDLMASALQVWEAVQSGQPPQLPEALWTDDYLNQLHPDRSGEVEVGYEVIDLVVRYDEISSTIKKLETEKDEIKTQLIGAIGSAEIATSGGATLFTYKTTNSKRIDTKKLGELFPEAAGDDRIYNLTTTRTLRINTKKEKE
jgi:putative phage-type endonuclease